MTVTITVSDKLAGDIARAIDFAMRMQIGQWANEIPMWCADLLERDTDWQALRADLDALRCKYAAHPSLRAYSGAYIGIGESTPEGKRLYDLWKELGCGVSSSLRFSGEPIVVERT